jgi:hypothetical protein
MFNFTSTGIFKNRKILWLRSQLTDNNVSFISLGGIIFVHQEDKDILNLIYDNNIKSIENDSPLFNKKIEKETIVWGYKKNLKHFINLLSTISDFNKEYKDDGFFIGIDNRNNHRVISINHKYDYRISELKAIREIEMINFIKDFKYNDIKLSPLMINQIKESAITNFLNGYDINFDNYSMTIKSNDNNSYELVFRNKRSFKEITLTNVKIDKSTKTIKYAGNENKQLAF